MKKRRNSRADAQRAADERVRKCQEKLQDAKRDGDEREIDSKIRKLAIAVAKATHLRLKFRH